MNNQMVIGYGDGKKSNCKEFKTQDENKNSIFHQDPLPI